MSESVFISSKNSKSNGNQLCLYLTERIKLENTELALVLLSRYYMWKNIK